MSLVIIRSELASLFCLVWHSGVHMRPAARCIPVWIRSLGTGFPCWTAGTCPWAYEETLCGESTTSPLYEKRQLLSDGLKGAWRSYLYTLFQHSTLFLSIYYALVIINLKSVLLGWLPLTKVKPHPTPTRCVGCAVGQVIRRGSDNEAIKAQRFRSNTRTQKKHNKNRRPFMLLRAIPFFFSFKNADIDFFFSLSLKLSQLVV